MRVITAAEIAEARLPLQPVYDLVLEGFDLVARGEVECPPKLGIHPRPGAFTHVMAAYVPTKDLAGTKVVSVYPDNLSKGLDATHGMILMQSPETGTPTHLVDAVWITNARTAMVSMVDVKYLANPEPSFGIVGATGAMGRAHIHAIATVFPGSRVHVGSRSRSRLDALLADCAALPCELIPTDSDEAIVRESDVVIVCTLSQS